MFPNISVYAIPGIPQRDLESDLIENVVKTFGISIIDFKSKSRQAPIPMARAVACFVYYWSFKGSVNISEMAKLLFVDRSTIYNYLSQVNNVIDTKDKNYYPKVRPLLEKYAPGYNHGRN